MKSILLVKTSSLGDVVHNLPVASDLHRAFPACAIDWVVEENFAAIPGAHAAIRSVLPVAIRRWRVAPWRRAVHAEICAFARALRRVRYDAIIDTQGLLKSALIACAARGIRYGLDWKSSREPLAVFYDRSFRVPWSLHAVERNRALAAQALGYAAGEIDYGVHARPTRFAWLAAQRYALLVHSTSATSKLWPEARWIELGAYLARRGIVCVMPWGSAPERARSERLAGKIPQGIVPPPLNLDEAMALFAGAEAVVGVDTGLTHLAAALGVKTIGIYCATDPARTGIHGCRTGASAGGVDSPPESGEVIRKLESLGR